MIAALAVTWAFPAAARAAHDIAWYQQHPAERARLLKICFGDMSYSRNLDCLNANEADVRLNSQRATDDLHRRGLCLPWEPCGR